MAAGVARDVEILNHQAAPKMPSQRALAERKRQAGCTWTVRMVGEKLAICKQSSLARRSASAISTQNSERNGFSCITLASCPRSSSPNRTV
jgi:hypothetical protein